VGGFDFQDGVWVGRIGAGDELLAIGMFVIVRVGGGSRVIGVGELRFVEEEGEPGEQVLAGHGDLDGVGGEEFSVGRLECEDVGAWGGELDGGVEGGWVLEGDRGGAGGLRPGDVEPAWGYGEAVIDDEAVEAGDRSEGGGKGWAGVDLGWGVVGVGADGEFEVEAEVIAGGVGLVHLYGEEVGAAAEQALIDEHGVVGAFAGALDGAGGERIGGDGAFGHVTAVDLASVEEHDRSVVAEQAELGGLGGGGVIDFEPQSEPGGAVAVLGIESEPDECGFVAFLAVAISELGWA